MRDRSEEAFAREATQGVTNRIILQGGGYGGSRTRLYYPLWMLAVFCQALRLPKGGTWYCLGFESAFPALIVSKWKRAKLIFDDADRFSMIVRLPRPLQKLLVSAERWASRHADVHIVPGYSRYEWHGANMRLLRNSPTMQQFLTAQEISAGFDTGTNSQGFTIYVNGWVGETRGAPVFLAAMKQLASQRPDAKLLVIGRGDKGAFGELITLSNVEYHTEVPQETALAYYYASDLVLTYYDPAIDINRHAESNKWGDCAFCGVPFVVNSEVETASSFVAAGAAFAVPYHDIEGLVELVTHCMDNPQQLRQSQAALTGFRHEFPPFDSALAEIMASILPPLS